MSFSIEDEVQAKVDEKVEEVKGKIEGLYSEEQTSALPSAVSVQDIGVG